MENNINILVLIVTYTFVVWCHMHDESDMKHKQTGNHMDMTAGNDGTGGRHGTMKVKLQTRI